MAATIISVTPPTGAPGTAVVILGTGFEPGAVVRFACGARNADDAAPVVASPGEIHTAIPDLLDGLAGTINISVWLDDAPSNELPFVLSVYPPVETIYPLCSLGELKKFLGVAQSETTDDAKLATLIALASAQIEGACGRAFRVVEIADELHDGDGKDILRPNVTPIVDVESLSIDGVPVPLSELKIYFEFVAFADGGDYNPRLRASSRVFPEGRQNVRISYSAGFPIVPRDISDACKIQVMFVMNTANKQGIVSETNQVAQSATTYAQSQLSPAVRVICNRYRKPRIAIA